MPLSPSCSLETHRWSPVGWMTYKRTALYEWYCNTPSHITVTHFHAIWFTTTDRSQQVKPVMFFSLTLWSPRWHRGSISRVAPGSEPYVRRCIIIYVNMQGSCSGAALGDLTPLRCKEHSESESMHLLDSPRCLLHSLRAAMHLLHPDALTLAQFPASVLCH